MKKILGMALVAMMAVSLVACLQREPVEVEPEGPAQVGIQFAEGVDLEEFDRIHEFVHEEEGVWLLITTNRTVNYFSYIAIDNEIVGERFVFSGGDLVWALPGLAPSTAFMVKTFPDYGTLPQFGVSFVDDGVTRYFFINQSQEDGVLRLVEFGV